MPPRKLARKVSDKERLENIKLVLKLLIEIYVANGEEYNGGCCAKDELNNPLPLLDPRPGKQSEAA